MPADPYADRWQTPASAAALIVPFLPDDAVIWEPACGDGRLLGALAAHGFAVYGSDLLTGTDFLAQPAPYGDTTHVVTNPPFSRTADWVAHCFALELPWALLMPPDSYTVQKIARQPLWRGVRALVPCGPRIRCYRPHDYPAGPLRETSPPQQLVWWTWRLPVPAQLHYVDYAGDQQFLFAAVDARGSGAAGV